MHPIINRIACCVSPRTGMLGCRRLISRLRCALLRAAGRLSLSHSRTRPILPRHRSLSPPPLHFHLAPTLLPLAVLLLRPRLTIPFALFGKSSGCGCRCGCGCGGDGGRGWHWGPGHLREVVQRHTVGLAGRPHGLRAVLRGLKPGIPSTHGAARCGAPGAALLAPLRPSPGPASPATPCRRRRRPSPRG